MIKLTIIFNPIQEFVIPPQRSSSSCLLLELESIRPRDLNLKIKDKAVAKTEQHSNSLCIQQQTCLAVVNLSLWARPFLNTIISARAAPGSSSSGPNPHEHLKLTNVNFLADAPRTAAFCPQVKLRHNNSGQSETYCLYMWSISKILSLIGMTSFRSAWGSLVLKTPPKCCK
jgi:hypothetical protein